MTTSLRIKRLAQRAIVRSKKKRKANRPRLPALLDWGQRYLPHRFTVAPSLFHRELSTDLDELSSTRGEKLARIAPRGSAKSTISTLEYVLKCALERSEQYIVIISDIQPNANKFLADIKSEIETNELLQEDYPESCTVGPVWREEAIELVNGVRIEALGKGGKIRGRRHRQHRPTLIILDDPQSFDDAYSPTQMEKDFAWLMSDVMKAGEPTTNFVVLGTALADECIVCKLAKTPGWKFKRYKSLIAEPVNLHLWLQWREMLWQHDDPQRDEKAQAWYLQNQAGMDEGAAVLWPERFPLVDIMRRRYSEGERAFMSEEQGEPMPVGDAEWPMDYFDWPGFWVKEWPPDTTISAHALDPSKGKESKQGDYQAFGRAARTRSGTIYVQAWLEKMDTQALSAFLVDRFIEQPSEAIAIEENGFQELLRIPIEQAVKARNASMQLPMVPLINTVKKEVRIRRLTQYLAKRQFRFLDTPGTRLLVDQLRKFPFADHDDGPDMLEMLIRVMIELSHVKKI